MKLDEPHRQLRIGFIGPGRLASALSRSLHRAGQHVIRVSGGSAGRAQRFAAEIPGCSPVEAQALVDDCDLVFITTPDAAIGPTVSQQHWRRGVSVVHCSGVTEVDALASAREQGASTGGFHPMQTFGDPDAAIASLPGSTITIEAQGDLDDTLVALAERLGCRVMRLPPGMRGRYHASAGFTSQFVNVLFAEAARVWASWGCSEEDAVRAMLPMVRGTLASIESAGIARGMPGPVSRGDVGSVQKHVAALAPLGPEVDAFYRLMCGRTVELARGCGAIDKGVAARLEAVLAHREDVPCRGPVRLD